MSPRTNLADPRIIGQREGGARSPRRFRLRAFSLVELLVAMAVLALVLVITASIVNETRKVWVSTMGMTSAFREARGAFESMTRRLSQATLNTYLDYVDEFGRTRAEVGAGFEPDEYARQSELHFVSGQAEDLLAGVETIPSGAALPGHAIFFQAPLGFADAQPNTDAQLVSLLNAVGYYVQYSDDSQWMPEFLQSTLEPKKRYRLMQMVQGSERLRIYDAPLTPTNRLSWFRDSLSANPVLARPVAENILTLVVWPRASDELENDTSGGDAVPPLTEDFTYDTKEYLTGATGRASLSRNQLPPQVQITLVALEEASAERLERMPDSEKAILAPGTLFKSSAPAATLQQDLAKLVDFLNSKGYVIES